MRRRMIARTVISLLVVVASLYIGVYAVCRHRMQRAKALVEQLQGLEAGKTPESQIKRLVDQYGGKYSPSHEENHMKQSAVYDLGLSSPYMVMAGAARTLPGLRIWGLIASLEVRDGYFNNLYLSLSIVRSDHVTLHSTVRLTNKQSVVAPHGEPYYVYEAHITGPPGEAMGVVVSPAASVEDRKKAFDLNFLCLTSFQECRQVCQILPSAWKDLTPGARLRYEDGTPMYGDSECRKAAH